VFGTSSQPLAIRNATLAAFAVTIFAFGPIALWNRYIFSEDNLPILLAVVLMATLVVWRERVPRGVLFPFFAICFWAFTLYAFFRLDSWSSFSLGPAGPHGIRPGIAHVLDLLVYFALFVLAAMLYYRSMRFSMLLWFLVIGYMVAFIVRNSLDLTGLQEGYNLSPGFVLLTLLPFAFLPHGEKNGNETWMPTLLLFFCVLWLALIGARTATVALLIFYGAMKAWPIITRNRVTYFGAFWGAVLSVAVLTVSYMIYASVDRVSLVEDSDIGFLQKRIGTRVEIWIHLLALIMQQPLLGYGTDHATFVVSPLSYLEFSLNRDNLSAHSMYFELLYRLGFVGLLGFLLILYSIWRILWNGREQPAARVAGAFLLGIVFFASTGEYLVFSDLQLRNGLGWIILGIGAGASLRAAHASRKN